MALTIERDRTVRHPAGEDFSLECPYCGVFAHMTPQSVPDVEQVLKDHRTYSSAKGNILELIQADIDLVYVRLGVLLAAADRVLPQK